MKISIVMTAFNIEHYIQKAIESVLNSTYKDIELILVEDCSTDKTLSVINNCLNKDNRVKLIKHEINVGAGQSRRDGIEASTGDYIITIDGDDEISPTFLEDLANKAKETDADIVSGGITIKDSDEDYTKTQSWGNRISTGHQKFQDYNKQRIIFLNNKIVRKSLYATKEEREQSIKDKVIYCNRRYCEDTPTIIPLMFYANKIAYCDNVGYIYNMRDTSLTHKTNLFVQNIYKALCAVDILEFFKNKPDYHKYMNVEEFANFMYIARTNINDNDINKYASEWIFLTCKLLDYMKERTNDSRNRNKQTNS